MPCSYCNIEMTKTNEIIEHQGLVQSINGSEIKVLIVQTTACAGCHAKNACTAADKAEKNIWAHTDDTTLQVGDPVIVYGQRSLGLKAVLLAFVIPFLLIILLIALLNRAGWSEVWSGTTALLSLLPYYGILSCFKKQLRQQFIFYARRNDINNVHSQHKPI